MANFEKIFKDLILVEGGYSNHPMDPGGETMYGITIAVARANGYQGAMRDLSLAQARSIYEARYFTKYNFQLIQNTKIAGELFEFTVNTGRGKLAVKFLQRAYNLLNKNLSLVEDGSLGPKTADMINKYKFYKSIHKVQNVYQGMFYIALAEKDTSSMNNLKRHQYTPGSTRFKTFIRGWIDHRVSIN
ncbi:MAG: hypothetical protein KAI79_06685 [Bacteroidales bacterium]|nr:hypothetical protein [Bacteroidales bacterium]